MVASGVRSSPAQDKGPVPAAIWRRADPSHVSLFLFSLYNKQLKAQPFAFFSPREELGTIF